MVRISCTKPIHRVSSLSGLCPRSTVLEANTLTITPLIPINNAPVELVQSNTGVFRYPTKIYGPKIFLSTKINTHYKTLYQVEPVV